MDLTGSLAVVTGATAGIGRATAFALGRAGARVAICARTEANVHAASRSGKNGFEGGTAYCASKHAVLGFSKALMLEVRRHNVRVVTICPGSVDTGLRESRANRTRVLTADDVAHAVLATLTVSDRAMISELDIRPTNP